MLPGHHNRYRCKWATYHDKFWHLRYLDFKKILLKCSSFKVCPCQSISIQVSIIFICSVIWHATLSHTSNNREKLPMWVLFHQYINYISKNVIWHPRWCHMSKKILPKFFSQTVTQLSICSCSYVYNLRRYINV
jgi:hypothetical protein